MNPALSITDLTFTYKGADAPALEGISLELEPGKALAVTGPAASGKTSFCLCLKGLIPQAREGKISGTIHALGKDVSRFRAQTLSREMGMVLQDPEVQIVGRTVFEDLAFGPRNFLVEAEEIRARIPRVLDQVGLAGYEDRATMDLSGGEKQRLAVAGVLASAPSFLILDEPASELDPAGRARLYALLKQLKTQKNMTLVIVDSRLEEMGDLIDQVLVLDRGQMVYAGPPQDRPRREVPVPKTRAPLPDGQPALTLRDLHFAYDSAHPVLRGIDLDLDTGGFTALMGHNGAGKTSLVKHLNGLIPCEQGEIRVLDRPIGDYASKELTSTVGFVFQNPDHQIFESSVEKEIAFGLVNQGLDRVEVARRVDETLEYTGLSPLRTRHPFTLGKGERQLIAVASIVALDPKLLVVDEPTTGLDPRGSQAVMDLLERLNANGTAILFISHDLDLVLTHARCLAVLDQGKITLDVPIDQALDHRPALEAAGILPPSPGEVTP